MKANKFLEAMEIVGGQKSKQESDENVYNELVNQSNYIKKHTRLELENLKVALNVELENLRLKIDNFGEIY